LLLRLTEEEIGRGRPIPSFRYETMWERHDDLKPTISNSWGGLPGEPSVESVKNKLLGLAFGEVGN
jgi:hypothetical protein